MDNNQPEESRRFQSPWWWVPSLYYAEGLPYVVVMAVSVIMYKRLGVSNTEIALYTSWLYLPWVIKPLWSPVIDIFRTKRFWIVLTQLLMGAGLAAVALTIPAPNFFRLTMAFFWLLAFNSATHDIAADGFYMLGLDEHQQAWLVGIRSTFYRLALLSGQGLLVMLAGFMETSTGKVPLAWTISFGALAGLFLVFAAYHLLILPHRPGDQPRPGRGPRESWADFLRVFSDLFAKKGVLAALAFLLLYRLGEAQLVKLAAPFLLDPRDQGGLALSTGEVGFVYGTVGILMLTLGGIAGGLAAARHGLKAWIWWMALAINLPDLVYVYLALVMPDSFLMVNLCVAVEQFGYGFGFTAYLLFMVYFAGNSQYQTAHYAIMTGFMALGMMLPGMICGWIQELIGYANFFIWVLLSTLPGFAAILFLDIDPAFGKKKIPKN